MGVSTTNFGIFTKHLNSLPPSQYAKLKESVNTHPQLIFNTLPTQLHLYNSLYSPVRNFRDGPNSRAGLVKLV